MNVVENLKQSSMKLRKERNPLAASITFALSEIEKFGKNSGNRETTNDEAIKIVQKLIATVSQNIEYAKQNGESDGKLVALNQEKTILENSLPTMVSFEELKLFVSSIDVSAIETKMLKGFVMKTVKAKYGALVDMKMVQDILENHV